MPVLPTLYFLLCPFPNLSYHLQELGTGRIVEGMHSSKRASYTATSDRSTSYVRNTQVT